MAHVFQETLSWFHGRHSIKAGFNYLWGDWAEQAAGDNLFGNVSFSNRFTGHPYADFLLGIPTSMSRESPPIFNETIRSTYDLFVMDDFKVNPKLTVNLGLRYEYHPYWTGTLSAFDIATGSIVVPDGYLSKVSPLYPAGFVPIVEASKAGYPGKTLIQTDTNNFAPRIGSGLPPVGNEYRVPFGVRDLLRQCGVQGRRGGQSLHGQRAGIYEPVHSYSGVSVGLSDGRQRRGLGEYSDRHPPRPAHPVQHAVQLHDRAPDREHRASRFLRPHGDAAGHLPLQHQPATAGQSAIRSRSPGFSRSTRIS